MRRFILLLGIGFLSLAMVSCGGKKKQPSATVVVQDYKPIGEGMKVGSYAMIGVAAIITVGLLARSGKS